MKDKPALDNVTVEQSATNGIKVNSVAWSNVISNSIIQNNSGSGIYVQTSGTSISNSLITANGNYGIYNLSIGDTWCSNSSITNNANYAASIDNSSFFSPTNLTFTGNGSGNKNGIEFRGGGDFTRNLIWKGGVTWFMNGWLTIGTAGILTIEPGATLKFAIAQRLTVYGKLLANGTSVSPILFTSAQSTPARGDWDGISFEAGTYTSQISYATVSYAGRANDAAILMKDKPVLNTITVEESSTNGIKALSAWGSWSNTISNSTIRNNNWSGVYNQGSGIVVIDSVITNNGSYGYYTMSSGTSYATNTTISNNTNYAASIDTNASFIPTNLTITGNGAGTKNGIEYRGGGNITVTQTWKGGVTWFLPADLTIGTAGILTIDPGATLKFFGTKRLTVYGKLLANGTAASPILLTSNLATPSPGSWQGIYFESGTSASQVSYTTIAYSGQYVTSAYEGAIVLNNSAPLIDHVTFSNSATNGIKVLGSSTASPAVKNCAFTGNNKAITNQNTVQDARLTYWNSTNGPSGSGSGSGQWISTNVTYEPWLTAAPSAPHSYTTTNVINRSFNPAVGVLFNVAFWTSLSGSWKVTFYNSGGAPVRTILGSGLSGSVDWDGTNDSSTLQPDGTYSYVLESTSDANDVATPVKGYTILDHNLQLIITSYSVTPAYFSPNGDTIQDTTTASATFNLSVNWTLNIKNNLNAIVRTATGTGSSMSYVWDGKNGSGVLQPDAVYTFELLATSGSLTSGQTKTVALDIIPATGSVSYPTGNLLWSNVSQNGNMNLLVNGTIGDLNLLTWTLEYGIGASPSSWLSLSNGTSAITNATIFNWATAAIDNGQYTLRLQVWDKAGNKTVNLVTFTVGHFKVGQAGVYEFDRAAGQHSQYLSTVPFTLNETIVIKNGSGQTVRTLINNVSRNGGGYTDTWDGKNDAGAFVPDGPYFYYATATAGGNGMTWDQSGEPLGIPCCSFVWNIYQPVDPYNNQRVALNYYLEQPSRVSIYSSVNQINGGCAENCILDRVYQNSGSHTIQWGSVNDQGAFLNHGYFTFAVNNDQFPLNAVVAYGTAPTISNLVLTPAQFSSGGGSQNLTLTLATFQSQTATVTVRYVNQSNLSTLRTITQNSVAAGNVSVSWDGTADNGMRVAPGNYTVFVTVTDAIGNEVKEAICTTLRN